MTNKILVTGSSRGIGMEIAKFYYIKKWDICITSRNTIHLNKLVKDWNLSGGQISSLKMDFTNKKDILQLKNHLSSNWNCLDTLIINVGSGKGEKKINSKFQNNYNSFQENFYSAFFSVSILKDLLRESLRPCIIIIGSISAFKNVNSPLSYAMAKKSLENFSKYLSSQLSPDKIRVNCLHLGHVQTANSSWTVKAKKNPLEFEEFLQSNTLTKSLIDPVEVADFVYSLNNSDYSRNLTGATVIFDSGISVL